ncbi:MULTISPECIES: glucosaminidase domain-containing protein [unclassified Enterococcus]|uniref:glucosaminidase domain-containing protein n=1 Tax=unclassified Enterococcus TaxID=2608891 RepID=UPI001554339E|nr:MULTISPECIES: glucosaminidase domain-containing protein [unclassified Enterococcus]MBS7576342.1 LysM peptidoglycan-binding domain-containing protein [Enterococcus sp. MMGLQ5-2]MBS7583574.1 LysM peptidoglycan-binding domain-containing protein [Enterococcus sp. MMGLQ5-1]NPD11436.1 LysM peptidoglycan-binding domain-containing protein [Enterococcus sp. MMGLQ5-1]NPD36180.1 LysM peptidoglycan-binding domain-containing protein [Enterococcus sp. MMGLQ5-2]
MNYIPRKLIRLQYKMNRQTRQINAIKKKSLSSITLVSIISGITLSRGIVSADETSQDTISGQAIDAGQIKTGNAFIDSIAPTATDLANRYDLYASVMIAQAYLESGSGQSGLACAPYYNLFGIKGSYQGNSVTMSTKEQSSDGNYTTIDAAFRSYPSYAESLEDYAQLLSTNFYQGARKSVAASYADATAFLTGRYATSLTYAQNLNAVIEQFDLTRFDNADGSSSGILSSDGTYFADSVPSQTSSKIYTVVSGDTLEAISELYHKTAEDLMSMNGLTASELQVGQKIVINQLKRPLITDDERQAAESQLYTILTGDTLSEIAHKFQISLEELMTWNGLTESLIYPGQQLIVKPADSQLQNAIQIRESQLALESEYLGETFNVPQLDNFSYSVKGNLEQYQVDYFSNNQWQSTMQKRSYSDSEIASYVNKLFDIKGDEETLEDGVKIIQTKGETLNNLRYTEAQLSVNIINQIDGTSADYFKNELLAKSRELKNKISSTVASDIVLRVNLTKDDATRFAVSWREGNVVYTYTDKDIDGLIAVV